MMEEQESNNATTDLGEYFWFICYLPPLFLALASLFPLFFYAPFYGALTLYALGLCCVLRYVSSPTIILFLFLMYATWLFPSAPAVRYNYNILWVLSLSCSLWLCVQASKVLKTYWQTLCADIKEAKQSTQLWRVRFGNLQEKHKGMEKEHESTMQAYQTLQQQLETHTKEHQEILQKYQRIEWEQGEAKAIIAGLRKELEQKEPVPRGTILSELREKDGKELTPKNRISLQDIAKKFSK